MQIPTCYVTESSEPTIPIKFFTKKYFSIFLKKQPPFVQAFVKDHSDSTNLYCIPNPTSGNIELCLACITKEQNPTSYAFLPSRLPKHYTYHIDNLSDVMHLLDPLLIGWGIGSYSFKNFSKQSPRPVKLLLPDNKLLWERLVAQVQGMKICNDLINTPAQNMQTDDLLSATRKAAQKFSNTRVSFFSGKTLASKFPTIHTVGRCGASQPKLIELQWNQHSDKPHIFLIGKGVCFDTGGLDLKPSRFMRNMKKDMGGAAHVIGLAHILMATNTPVQLTVLIPAVENNIGSTAFRPGDVIKTRSGLHVEIDNTDAEGRLVLCDAITYAEEKKPDLIIDMATLTGAARVALGEDIVPFYTNNASIANDLRTSSCITQDYLWEMPLFTDYNQKLSSSIADISNADASGMAGSITAALFLNHFIKKSNWLHLDIYAWKNSNKLGIPEGGYTQSIRALYHFICKYYVDTLPSQEAGETEETADPQK